MSAFTWMGSFGVVSGKDSPVAHAFNKTGRTAGRAACGYALSAGSAAAAPKKRCSRCVRALKLAAKESRRG